MVLKISTKISLLRYNFVCGRRWFRNVYKHDRRLNISNSIKTILYNRGIMDIMPTIAPQPMLPCTSIKRKGKCSYIRKIIRGFHIYILRGMKYASGLRLLEIDLRNFESILKRSKLYNQSNFIRTVRIYRVLF